MLFLPHSARISASVEWLCILALVFVAQFSSGSANAQAQATSRPSVLSAKTKLVAVPVGVTDRHGNFVPGLTIRDFQIFVDGRPQAIAFFEQEDTPVTVGLLVDHSGSMGPKLPAVAAAISDFARSSNTEDQMFVVDFGDAVSIALFDGASFTNSAPQIEHAIASVSARGRTALYDAVAEGLTHLRLGKWNKHALVLVSDGGDNASRYKFSDVLQMARSSHAVIYSIGLLSESGQEESPDILRRLCRDTGGIAFFPNADESIALISGEIARDLRSQYMLGFEPPKGLRTGAYHKIEVKVSAVGHGKLRVRTRAGYTESAESGGPSRSGAL